VQTAKGSLVETLVGTAVGFGVSVLLWEVAVKPIWGIETSFVENLSITTLFTIASIARGYVVRRFFNYMHTNKNKRVQYDNSHRNHGPSPVWKR